MTFVKERRLEENSKLASDNLKSSKATYCCKFYILTLQFRQRKLDRRCFPLSGNKEGRIISAFFYLNANFTA